MMLKRTRGPILAIAAVTFALGIFAARHTGAAALGRGDVVPVSGAWCGLTADGGTVRFNVTNRREIRWQHPHRQRYGLALWFGRHCAATSSDRGEHVHLPTGSGGAGL